MVENLGKFIMSIIDRLHTKIDTSIETKSNIWTYVSDNSGTYVEALRLAPRHLKELSSKHESFLTVDVEGETFEFTYKNVCGANYNQGWKEFVILTCTSNNEINHNTGGGTSFVNVVHVKWHQIVLEHIRNN